MTDTIPTIDLSAFVAASASERRIIASEVDDICRSIGFLIIKNHGIDNTIIDRAWSSALSFFELPAERKLEAHSNDPTCPRGYSPPQFETLAKSRGIETPPDRKETFSSGALCAPERGRGHADFDFFYGPNNWPTEPVEFRSAWISYYHSMEQLGTSIMQLFAMALKLPIDYFTRFHTHHISALRANYYPQDKTAYLPNQERAGAHSDYGSVTILRPDPDVGGLEVRLPSGKWLAAPMIEDTFVINIGDMLARWTNDRWVSTLHRVVEPKNSACRRMSIAYFQVPNYDAKISCIPTCIAKGEPAKYSSVDAGPYLMGRFRATIQPNFAVD
jgi:isopenicillin N synthase-like dioxygenase